MPDDPNQLMCLPPAPSNPFDPPAPSPNHTPAMHESASPLFSPGLPTDGMCTPAAPFASPFRGMYDDGMCHTEAGLNYTPDPLNYTPAPATAKADPDAAFKTLTGQEKETVSEADAPKNVKLPKELVQGMQKAWDGSLPGGKSQEQGGFLVKNKDDKYEWRAGAAGDSGSFSPNYSDIKAGEKEVALGHTHPYDKSEGGYTNVPFSGQDLARQVYVNDPLSVVQSDKGMFGSARTKEFEKMLEGLDDKGKKKLFDEMKKGWDDTYKKSKGQLPDRADAATKAIAHKYHLLYYKGTGDTMNLVDTAPPKPKHP